MTYRDCVYPFVHTTYVRQQEAVVECLRDNHLHLSGDGHCDSPEYIAKYATYSLIYVTRFAKTLHNDAY